MSIVVKYAKAYLTIMARYPNLRTIYFDGFAGSGIINDKDSDESKKGTALQILDIKGRKAFDFYYFVEANSKYKKLLETHISENYTNRHAFVVQDDCNIKLHDLAKYLRANKNYRALAFIDPYGMNVD